MPLWTPDPDRADRSQMAEMARHHGLTPADGASLWQWSIEDPAGFWGSVWDRFDVIGERQGDVIRPAEPFWQTRWFPETTLSYAENMLRRRDEGPAIIFRREDGVSRTMSWAELAGEVARVQRALLADGVGPGDRVAAWLPNCPETYVLMLAASSIGAVFSSSSPDFGVGGVTDRFGQITPKVLVVADGYVYGGKTHDRRPLIADIVAGIGGVDRLVVLPFAEGADPTAPVTGVEVDHVSWSDWLVDHPAADPTFARLPFDHPLFILFSSGTTGAPKCIVHKAGGILLKHLVEHRLHCDVRRDDRVFYFTTAGWMMWNWLASGLASEAAIVVYDGSPVHPRQDSLFDLADEVGVTLFGTSAKFIDGCRKAGLRPADSHDLSSIRTITSTGSPLVAEGFEHVYADWTADVHLASISGGTDLCGCLVIGDPTRPVNAGEIQTAALGLDIDVVDPSGESLPAGSQGELVCRSPFPSMPRGFWDDPGDERYKAAYFEAVPGCWHQGDFAERTAADGFIIYGRSDATLNPGGVRIGTAEIYRQVEALDEIAEAIVIGQNHDDDVRVVLFVVMAADHHLDDDLRARIRTVIRTGASPRHVPAVIAEVPEIPRTRSGKIVELAVREVVEGRQPRNVEALANPDALAHFADRPELAP